MPWTIAHLLTMVPAMILMLGIAIGLSKVLADKEDWCKILPVQVVAVILIILEIFKQIFGAIDGYDLWYLPLHFCSMFSFLFALFAFYRGRYAEEVRVITAVAGSMLLLCLLIAPNSVFGKASINNFFIDFMSFHNVAFHIIVIFGFFYIISAKLVVFRHYRDCRVLSWWITIYSLIASSLANILDENYNNFKHCVWDVLDNIRETVVNSIGWFGQLIYVICVYVVLMIAMRLCYYLLEKFDKFVLRKSKEPKEIIDEDELIAKEGK